MTLLVFLYAAAAIFVLGNALRVARVAAMPAHLRWELYPIPRGPKARQRYGGSYFEETAWWTRPRSHSWRSEVGYILGEVLAFTTVRKRNPPLWLWSWLMHVGLYLLAIVAAWIGIAAVKGGAPHVSIQLCAIMSSCAGLAGVSGLFARRVNIAQVSAGTSRGDLFNLLILAAVFASALCVHLSSNGTAEMVTLARALLRLGPVPAIGWAAGAHFALLGIFAAYFPATHMTHAYMKFFTYHRVRWDDVAVADSPEMSRTMSANLRRPITWAAPHIAAAGKSTWAGIVGGERP